MLERLLSPVAVEMILLSNQLKKSANTTKVIEIKPLRTYKETRTFDQDEQTIETLTTDYERLKSKYASLEREIAKLEKQKVEKIISIKEVIDQEKTNWATEKEQLIQQAEKEGYDQGFHKGEATAMEQYADRLKEANDIIKLATKDYQNTVRESEYTIVELATHIAEKIVRKQIDLDDDVILRIVEKAIDQVTEEKQLNIFVSPEDYEQLLQHKSELQNLLDDEAKLVLHISKESEQGQCEIEYPTGKTDISITTQLNQIEKELIRLVTEKEQ